MLPSRYKRLLANPLAIMILVAVISIPPIIHIYGIDREECSRSGDIVVFYDPRVRGSGFLIENLAALLQPENTSIDTYTLTWRNLARHVGCYDTIVIIGHTTSSGLIVSSDGSVIPPRGIFELGARESKWVVVSCNNPSGLLVSVLRDRGKLLYYSGPVTVIDYSVLEGVYRAVTASSSS